MTPAAPRGTQPNGFAVTDGDLARLIDLVPDVVLVVDSNADVVWANDAASQLVGVERSESTRVNCFDLVHPDDLQMALLSMGTVFDKSVGSLLELRIRATDGWRLVEMRGTAIDDLVVLCIRDITQRRRWEVARDDIAQYRSLTQNSASLTILVEPNGTVRSSSAALPRLLGHDPEWLEGRLVGDLVAREDMAVLAEALDRVNRPMPGGRHQGARFDLRLQRLDGTTVPYSVRLTNLVDDQSVQGIVLSGHDISDRVEVERRLEESKSRLEATLESTADGILTVDERGWITSFNQRFLDMWSLDGTEIADRAWSVVLERTMDRVIDPATVRAGFTIPDGANDERTGVIDCTDGRVIELYSLPQLVDGVAVGRVWSFRDITERRQMEGRLTHQAYHDSLTGLANQARFRTCVAEAVERIDGSPDQIAVLFIDIDEFKIVNDTLGHSAGDTLLRIIAERLTGAVRSADTVARLGGDEFALVLGRLGSRAEALEIADRLLGLIRQPVEFGSKRHEASVSIGIAFGGDGLQADELLRNADLAMYAAKRAGKNCSVQFTPNMHQLMAERVDLEGELRTAVENGELVLHYQPVFDLATGTIDSFEALVRWDHPDKGLIGPASFIPFAEECGFIEEIGDHILRLAIHEAAGWAPLAGGVPPSISINVSPRQLLDTRIVNGLSELLVETGLSAQRVVLEVSEGALMKDPATTSGAIQQLRSLGVRIAVDDFGTGHSSLAYLQRFPVDILKVDGSFVVEVLTTEGTPLAQAIVQIAHSLGLACVAEGVESQAQADRMASFGCRLAQGYHLGRPLDAAATRLVLEAAASDGR